MPLDELSQRARQLANDLFSSKDEDEIPCTSPPGKSSCMMQEEQRPLTTAEKKLGWVRRPFSAYDPARMCSACASYFWVEMAAQTLHNMHCHKIRSDAAKERAKVAQ